MASIIRRKDDFYVVAYDGVDPLTGKERRRWHPVGHDRAEAEGCAARLGRVAFAHPPGALVALWRASANSDEAVFDRRADPRPVNLGMHLGFGRGIPPLRRAPLARVDARVVLTKLRGETSGWALDRDDVSAESTVCGSTATNGFRSCRPGLSIERLSWWPARAPSGEAPG